MTNKENINMNSTEIELKAIAKAIGGSLKRAGHAVPHTAVLHAVSAALDKRDWHKVKAALTAPVASVAPAAGNAFDASPTSYSERTLFALRMALACGSQVLPVPAGDEQALAAARAVFPAELDCILSWGGWNLPVTMNPLTSAIDVGNFKPSDSSRKHSVRVTLPIPGQLTLHLAELDDPLVMEVAYNGKDSTWYLTKQGAEQAYEQLAKAVPLAEIFPPSLPGEAIRADFWTDDRVVEAQFDARPFFMQATAAQIGDIIGCGYRGDYPTDAVADFISDKHLDEGVENGFSYIATMQKASRRDAPGFECSVDQVDMLNWLNAYRHDELALALCERVGSIHEEEEEFMGGIEGYAFVPTGQEYQLGTTLHRTLYDAAMVASRELGLFERALNSDL